MVLTFTALYFFLLMTYLYDKLLTGFLLHKKEDIVPLLQ